MSKPVRARTASQVAFRTPRTVAVPELQESNIPSIKQLESPKYTSQCESSVVFQSLASSPRVQLRRKGNSNPEKIQIFRDVRSIFKTCRGGKKSQVQNNLLRMSRDQKQILYLSPELRQFSREHKLREKKVQIQYVNTLKKIKKKGEQMGCLVRAKSQGIQLQLIKDKEQKRIDKLNYTMSKDLGRFFKKKFVREVKKCKEEAVSIKVAASNHCQYMSDILKINQREARYKKYNCRRIDTYMKAKATQRKKYPFYVKTQIDQKIARVRRLQLAKGDVVERDEELVDLQPSSPKLKRKQSSKSPRNYLDKNGEGVNSGRVTMSSKKSQKWKGYQEDVDEFLEICQFFQKIQHELLKFLPNNHLANKIDVLISQVQNSDMIQKIYHKANRNLSYFDQKRIVAILKERKGILGTLNYIVNIIKLKISAERRKRVKDRQDTLKQYQQLVHVSNNSICDKLRTTTDQTLKKDIWQTLNGSQGQCLAMNQAYIDFTENREQDDTNELHTKGNRNIICQILKYQAMLR